MFIVMTRQRHELEQSKQRLTAAMDLLQDELRLVEAELDALKEKVRLDKAFFWDRIVPMLLRRMEGISSAEIIEELSNSGFGVSSNALRVFLSRCKDKGELQLSLTAGEAPKWRVSGTTLQRVIKLGLKPEWFDE